MNNVYAGTLSVLAVALSGMACPLGAPGLSSRRHAAAAAISGQDVNGHSVAVNGKGHYTVVMYTNPGFGG